MAARTPTAVVFYDLTTVHCHGLQNGSLVCFGRSKQKRSDCPLISMAPAINRAGFPCYCEIFPGNIAESKTLQQMLTQLRARHDEAARPTVVMHAGIGTEANLQQLAAQGYPWVRQLHYTKFSCTFVS